MRKLATSVLLLASVMLFQFCNHSKHMAASAPAAVTYQHDVLPVVQASCGPCHVAGQGNKKPLDNYADAKSSADDIIKRIQMNPDERGFMPMRHPKMSDSAITAFVDWKKGGLLEK